jgi:hypothetical protein
MTVFLVIWAVAVLIIAGLALGLPCEGCRLRRERLRRTLAEWRDRKSG